MRDYLPEKGSIASLHQSLAVEELYPFWRRLYIHPSTICAAGRPRRRMNEYPRLWCAPRGVMEENPVPVPPVLPKKARRQPAGKV